MTGYVSTKTGMLPVKCYPVTIPGFEAYSFIIHHPIDTGFDKKGWVISDPETGFLVFPHSWSGGLSNRTKAGAIAIAREYLERNKDRFIAAKKRYKP